MDRAIRILLFVAALTVGWAPVAQTVHAAVAPALAIAGTPAIVPLHHHDHLAGAGRQDQSGKAAPIHPAVCAACVGLPAIWAPPTGLAADGAPDFVPLSPLVAFLAPPASPPPRA